MTRKLKAILPTGDEVAIDIHNEPTSVSEEPIKEKHELLKSLLNFESTKETHLHDFLANSLPVIFEDADVSHAPVPLNQTQYHGVDLVFRRKNSLGIAGVELKHHRMKQSIKKEQVERQLNSFIQKYPNAEVLYLIGSEQYLSSTKELDNISDKIYVKPLSWEGICKSLEVKENDYPEATVILVDVANFSRNLIKRLLMKPSLITDIDDRKFEEVIATLLFDIGLEDVQITENSAKSRDIIVTHRNPITKNKEVYFIECKHWVSGRTIKASWAIKLERVVKEEEATAGILLSSSGFGPKLIEQTVTFEKNGIYLRKNQDITKWLQIWERRYGSVIVEPVSPRDILGIPSEAVLT